MRARPEGVGEDDVRVALAEGWRIDAAAMRYAAVGGGSYHWCGTVAGATPEHDPLEPPSPSG